ncbi:MAG: hypothetical protein KJ686_01315 [Actinobacteria bacterium]|nr:hypothetical protein [Actinomycetota bacterium]
MTPEKIEAVRTSAGYLWVEDDILRVKLTKSNPTLEDFESLYAAGETLARSTGKRIPSVTDTGPVSRVK